MWPMADCYYIDYKISQIILAVEVVTVLKC